MTSNNANVPPDVKFESQDLLQNRSLETVPIALFGGVSHMTILVVLTRVMDVRDQTR